MIKMKIAIVGAGQMGTQIGKAASESHNVIFYDIDPEKSRSAAELINAEYSDSLQDILTARIIFLCVPGKAVTDLLREYHSKTRTEVLWVNISTFVTLKDLIQRVGPADNIVSLKIVGHFERISPDNKGVFVIHEKHPANEQMTEVKKILKGVGTVIYDDEEKYLEVNYIAAAEAMKGVLNTANLLKMQGLDDQVLQAAVKQVFVGTALQFPYAKPDYFHELVYERNPGLRSINENLLNPFSLD